MPLGLARRLLERIQSSTSDREGRQHLLLSYRRAFLAAACTLKLSIAPVERLHSENRARAHHQMRWSTFAAKMVNAERQAIANAARPRRRLQGTSQTLGMGSQPVPAIDMLPKLPLRQSTAYQCFKTQCETELRASGQTVNPCSSVSHARCRTQFGNLPADEMVRYEAESEASKHAAKLARELLRRGQAPVLASPLQMARCSALDVSATPCGGSQDGVEASTEIVAGRSPAESHGIPLCMQPENVATVFSHGLSLDSVVSFSTREVPANCAVVSVASSSSVIPKAEVENVCPLHASFLGH